MREAPKQSLLLRVREHDLFFFHSESLTDLTLKLFAVHAIDKALRYPALPCVPPLISPVATQCFAQSPALKRGALSRQVNSDSVRDYRTFAHVLQRRVLEKRAVDRGAQLLSISRILGVAVHEGKQATLCTMNDVISKGRRGS